MELLSWLIFGVVILGLLIFDLFYSNKKPHEVTTEEATKQSIFYIVIALLFGAFVFFTHGGEAASEYFTAYAMEKTLSVDNLFVILLILQYFQIPVQYYHRVLYVGILSAIVLRALCLGFGVALVSACWPVLLGLGAWLVWGGYKMFQHAGEDDEAETPEENQVVKWLRKKFPVTDEFDGPNFTKVINGVRYLTPIALALVMIETSDIMFAADSIPAVLSVSQKMFVVYTSNIFAILGLRSLFFIVSSLIEKFHKLKYGISLVLMFIGVKLLTGHFIHIDPWLSLGIVATTLVGSCVLSVVYPKPVKT